MNARFAVVIVKLREDIKRRDYLIACVPVQSSPGSGPN